MMISIAIATLVLTLATALPLWQHPHWLVRGLDFPRLQLAVLAFLLLLSQMVLLDIASPIAWTLMAISLSCLCWQLWWILPYTPLWRPEVKRTLHSETGNRLSILTANVLMTNTRAETLLSLVRQYQPDILVTLESDHWWQQQLDTLQDLMPYSIRCPLDNLYGMHVYSRLVLEQTHTSFLVEEKVPSMHAQVVLRTGDKVRMHFLHPAPPSPTENSESTERDAELIVVAQSLMDSKQPAVVTGDLNDVAWSATTRLFRKLSGLLDPRIGRGMFNTFHARYPFLRWPLDHVFHSHHFMLSAIQRLPYFGSDHFALLTELSYQPGRGEKRAGITADCQEKERAAAFIEERPGVSTKEVPDPGH